MPGAPAGEAADVPSRAQSAEGRGGPDALDIGVATPERCSGVQGKVEPMTDFHTVEKPSVVVVCDKDGAVVDTYVVALNVWFELPIPAGGSAMILGGK